jgi:hypothetical protein
MKHFLYSNMQGITREDCSANSREITQAYLRLQHAQGAIGLHLLSIVNSPVCDMGGKL